MVWTEQAIKACLDGSFTRVDHWGNFVTDTVPIDFIPTHRSRKTLRARSCRPESYRRWTAAEDALLLNRAAHGLTIIGVGKILGRGEDSMRHRVKLLREKAMMEKSKW